MNLTISDIARLANVSKSAVSIVLNNRPGVSDKTREKILGIIKKYNYHPNQLAQSLVVKKTKSVGLVITEIDNPFFTKVMKGVYDTCYELGYNLLIGSSELSPLKEKETIRSLESKLVEGLIISPLQGEGVDYLYLSKLINNNFPFVMLRNIINYPINLVDIDNTKAAYDAVNYLIKLGHKKIAYFSGPKHSGHSIERFEGYKQALIENGITVEEDNVVEVGSYLPNGYECGKEYFKKKGKNFPTAVFCYNDLVAIGLFNALNEMGINVPEDISVMGFDNIDFSQYVKKPLSTIHMPAFEIGKAAVHLLMKQISQPEKFLNEKIILKGKLIIRESCASKINL